MPAGAPTKYKEEFCETVIELMKEGAGKAEVCAELGICKNSFYAYQDQHPEFMTAVKKGEYLCQGWWEKQGRVATFGGIDGYNSTSYIFNMKNRFPEDWKDKRETDLTSSDGSLTPPVPQYVVVDK